MEDDTPTIVDPNATGALGAGDQPSSLLGVERNEQVDQRLQEFGVLPEETSNTTEADKTKTEEAATTPETTTSETPTEEKPEETVTPPGETVTPDAAKKIVEDATGTKGEQEKYPWELENREPTTKEVLDYVAKKSAELVQAQQAAKVKEQQDLEEKARQDEETRKNAWTAKWQSDLENLENSGQIPPAKNKDGSINQRGVDVRDAIWKAAAANKELDLEKAWFKYVKDKKQPSGAKAPIAAGNQGVGNEDREEGEYGYDEISGVALSEIGQTLFR